MAFNCTTDSVYVTAAVDGLLQMSGSWSQANPIGENVNLGSNWGLTYPPTNSVPQAVSQDESGTWYSAVSVGYDAFAYVRCWANDTVLGYVDATNYLSGKANAQAATAQTPTSSSVTSSTATIACDYVPNVNSSSCSAQLQYKKTTEGTWTNAGSAQSTGGSVTVNVSRNITGLEASTQYQVRLVITRTTNNLTSTTSATASFTTLAGEPLVTTDAATNVAATTATLNGTLDINAGTGVNVYFKYGTDNPPTQNTTANQSKSADGTFEQAVSGLTANTTYYVQAFTSFSTPSGSPNEGSVESFLTPADPLADAVEEDHVKTFYFDRKYGVEDAVVFTVPSPAATSSDRFLNAAVPWVAGDVKISIDGGAVANVTNLPTRIGSTPLYTITLTAAEMQGSEIDVYLVDADGPAWRDTQLKIRTELLLGNVQVDAATGQKANTSAVVFTGYGSGNGLAAVAGATGQDINGVLGEMVLRHGTATAGAASSITLDASASSTNDYYNGSIILIISGTGAGQSRVITDYVGSTLVATVNRSWSTNPANGSVFLIIAGPDVWEIPTADQLSAIPTGTTGKYGDKLQALFQRFFFKRTQTTTTQTLFKSDSSTALGTATVSDDGATQSSGKIA